MGLLFNLLVVAAVTCHISTSAYRVKRQSVEFSEEEKELLRRTWRGTIQPFSDENAANLFIDYITKNPELRNAFFWGRNDKSPMALRVDSRFTSMVNAVFQGIGVGIGRLDNMDSLNRFYSRLGEDHIPRGVYPALFAPLKNSFIYILGLALGDEFTPAVEAAYGKYYTHITGLMAGGLAGGDSAPLDGITAAEKAAAEAGWAKFAEDVAGNGAATFITLVHDHPEIRDVFPWGGKSYLSVDDPDIRHHAELVFNGVGVAFNRIGHIHSLDGYYESLGLRHIARKVEMKFFDHVGDALGKTFQQILGGDYTADFKSGSSKVYAYITQHMTAGLRGAGELTKGEKAAVRAGFAQITDLGLFGAKVFSKLVTMHPDIRSKFPWGSKSLGPDALIQDADVQRHANQVFRSFALTIANMDDVTSLTDYFFNEGMEHIVRGLDTEDFQKLEDAMLATLNSELGALYTKEFKRGIESLYAFTVGNMLRGIHGETQLTKSERNEAAAAWNIFEANLVENGIDVFINLIHEHPSLEHIFPWGTRGLSEAALRDDAQIKRHASLVFGAVAPAFSKLDNLGALNNFYLDIGNNHLDRNIPPVTFSYLSAAFKKTFSKILGADYTESFEHSFDYVYAFITSRMLEGMSGIKTLSDAQKISIKSAFATFSDDLAANGALVFLKFVHDYPSLVTVFPWGKHPDVDYEDMFVTYKEFGQSGLNRAQLSVYGEMSKHANQVFGGLMVAVDGIENFESLAQYYNSLGVRHIARGATAEQFLWMGDAILYGFKNVLGNDYTAEFETGFHILYNFITKHLNEGLGGGVVLTANEKSALVAGFAAAKDSLGKIGANAFVNLIEGDASYKARFPWAAHSDKSTAQLRSDPGAIAHGAKVLHGIAVAVEHLDNLNAFVPYFVDEGVRHVPRLVTGEDFHAMATALLPAFEQELGGLYTNDFKNALVAVVNFIADNMAKGLDLEGQEAIHLSPEEAKDVSLAFYQIGDIGAFGARVFGRLVHDHPKIRNYFPWARNDMNEHQLVNNPATHVHAVQVFGTLAKVVHGAHNLNDFRSFLVFKGLGHIPRGIKPEHFSWLKVALEAELKQELGDRLTADGEAGFNKVYDFVQRSMLKGLAGSTAVSFAQKVALERGWGQFEENVGANGAEVFIELIKSHPSFRPFFPWARNDKTLSQLVTDPAAQRHAEQVFGALGAAIHHSDNLDAVRKYYYDLGVNHLNRAVRKEHFGPLQDATEVVLKRMLGGLYTDDLVEGFETVFAFVAKEMTSGLGDSTDLTSSEREMLLDAYGVINQDLLKNAQNTFLHLIQEHPDLKQVFPWGDIPTSELRTSEVFNHHILSVFKGIAVGVQRLGNVASTTNYYIHLGQNHITRGATDEAFAAIGESLLHTFKLLIGANYNDEFVTAFTHIYEFITGNMKVGMAGHGDVEAVELSAAEQAAVTSGIAKITDLGEFGRTAFIKFITDHPETRNLFPWGRNTLVYDALRHSQKAYHHAEVVFKNVMVAVDRLDSLGTLSDFYTTIGVNHLPRHLEHKHFAWMGEAINSVFADKLGGAYSGNFQAGWDKVYAFIIGRMERGMTSGKSLTDSQKELVAAGWGVFAENLVDNGAAVFAKYVTKYPEYRDVFPWGGNAVTESGIKYDPEARAHAKVVFTALGELLADVSQLKNHRKDLVALGRRHIPRNVGLEHLLRMGVVLDEYFEELLGDDYSLEFRLGWDIVYANIVDGMGSGLQIHH